MINFYIKRVLLYFVLSCFFLPSLVQGEFTFSAPQNYLDTATVKLISSDSTNLCDVARPFYGTIKKKIGNAASTRFFIAGGSMFDQVSGTKSVTDRIVMFEKRGMSWTVSVRKEKLPAPMAEGVTLSYQNGFLLIGGTDRLLKESDTVVYMSYDDVKDNFEFSPFPAFPAPFSMGCGGVIQNRPYVFGNGMLSVFNGTGWEVLDGIPRDLSEGILRKQSCGTALVGDQDVSSLYLFGGYDANDDGKKVLYDVWKMTPRLSSDSCLKTESVWKRLGDLVLKPDNKADTARLFCTIGAQAVPLGAQSILLVGGSNADVWEKINGDLNILQNDPAGTAACLKQYYAQPEEAFKWNREMAVFHTVIEEGAVLTSAGGQPIMLNRGVCGAACVYVDQMLAVIGGEIKPACRTSDIQMVNLALHRTFGTLNWIIFLTYLGLMLPFGYIFMRKNKTTDDYFKGGSRIPWWVTGVAIFAAMLSSITFMTVPAMTFSNDWRFFPLTLSIFAIAPIVIYFYLPFYRRLNITSAYEYLEKRFNPFSRVFASAAFVIFMVVRSAIVVYLPSLALSIIAGMDIYLSILLVGAVTVIYSTIGGVTAVIWSEFIQAVVLIGGALVAVLLLIYDTPGGVAGTFNIAMASHKLCLLDLDWSFTAPVLWVTLIGGVATNLGSYTSDQTIVQKYMTTKDEKAAARSIWLNGILSVICSALFYFIGTCLYAFYKTNPTKFDWALYQNDAVFPTYIVSQMPAGVSGLLIAAIFAAAMSTLSANFNSAATAFVSDFYRRFFTHNEEKAFKMAKTSTWVIGVLAIGFALLISTVEIESLFKEFQKVIGILTGGLAGLFVMGIFIPRINGSGAIAGLFASYFINILFIYTDIIPHKPHFLLYGAVGLTACIAVGYLVSLFSGRPHLSQLKNLTYKHLDKK